MIEALNEVALGNIEIARSMINLAAFAVIIFGLAYVTPKSKPVPGAGYSVLYCAMGLGLWFMLNQGFQLSSILVIVAALLGNVYLIRGAFIGALLCLAVVRDQLTPPSNKGKPPSASA